MQRHLLIPPPRADKLLVILSDIEMGSGGPTDDFPQTDYLAQLIKSYNQEPFHNKHVELIFNGDTFDFLKVSVEGKYPHCITRDIALAKLNKVASVHSIFFQALQDFLSYDKAHRKVTFIVGNHDQELLFPEVQAAITTLLDNPQNLSFPGLAVEIGDVHIEHGSQKDSMFHIDPAQPFIMYQGEPILNLPWASVALLEATIPMHPALYHYDRLKPRNTVFQLLPELKDLLMSRFWQYWLHDYWIGVWKGKDPLRKLTWTMFKEVLYRFRSHDADISVRRYYQAMLRHSKHKRLLVIGHEHEPYWWGEGNKKLLQTGCFRNEFMVETSDDGEIKQDLLPCVYAEVWMQEEHVVRSYLVELNSSAPPAGYIPDSIFARLPYIKKHLGERKEHQKHQEAWEAQEKNEEKKLHPKPPSQQFK